MRVVTGSDIGLRRRSNQDAWRVLELPASGDGVVPHLLVVADGMGGHRGGEVASRLAVRVLSSELENGGADWKQALYEAVLSANREVLALSRQDARLAGMGTTLTAAVLSPDDVIIAHVGDSRAYLCRDGAAIQLTEDHSLVAELLRQGKLTPEEALRHPQRNVLLRALGTEEDVPVDLLRYEVAPGDRLLLTTDGLSGLLSAEEIAGEACLRDFESLPERLIAWARRRGAPDNVTVIAAEV